MLLQLIQINAQPGTGHSLKLYAARKVRKCAHSLSLYRSWSHSRFQLTLRSMSISGCRASILASTCRPTPDSSVCRAIRSTTRRRPIGITSFTTAFIGSTSKTTGMSAVGTTDHGSGWVPRTCRCTCCAFRCAITVDLRHISSAGIAMSPLAGATIGAGTGSRTGAAGISGIAGLRRLRRFCRTTSGSIRARGILVRPASKMRFDRSITTTSLVSRSRGNISDQGVTRATVTPGHSPESCGGSRKSIWGSPASNGGS